MEVGEVTAITGGVESGVYVSEIIALPWLAIVLRAVTVTFVTPVGSASPLIAQLLVPVANPLAPWSVAQVTWVTPALSNAVPLRLIVLLDVVNVELKDGDVIAIAMPDVEPEITLAVFALSMVMSAPGTLPPTPAVI